MNPQNVAARVGLYTVVMGGGSIAVTWLLPSVFHFIGILSMIGLGVLLLGWGVLSEDGPKAGGIQLTQNASGGMTSGEPGMSPTGPVAIYYAAGLIVFGVLGIIVIV